MEIKHPRRLLIVSSPGCDVAGLVKDLTGSVPITNTDGSLAGTTHEWSLETNYYKTNVPIWVDEISDREEWTSEFQKSEAKEVVQAVGGWIYCVDKSQLSQPADDISVRFEKIIKSIEDVITKACGYSWEGIKLAVATTSNTKTTDPKPFSAEEWDDRCMEYGFEFIDAEAQGKNQFGEKTGMDRLREALEANDWTQTAGDEGIDDDAFGDFQEEEHEMSAELWGLKASLLGAEDESDGHDEDGDGLQVDNLEQLMNQALAIRENGADLPLEERRKYAARAVNSLMNDL